MWKSRHGSGVSALVAAGLATCLGLLSGCGSGDSSGSSGATGGSNQCGSIQTVTLATNVQSNDPLNVFQSVAAELGYYKQDCVNFQLVTVQTPLQAVQAGLALTTPSTPDILLPLLQQGGDTPQVKAYFTQIPRSVFALATPASSSVKTLQDLRGKTIATLALGYAGTTTLRIALTNAGLNPDKDVKIVALAIGPAVANAVKSGQVQALNYPDTFIVQIQQLTGEQMRPIPLGTDIDVLPGTSWIARTSDLQSNPKIFLGTIRGWCKAFVFIQNNLRAALQIHLKLYPELIPAGQTADQEIAALTPVLNARLANMKPRTDSWAQPPLYGYMYREQWTPYLKIVPGLKPDLDVTRAYTNMFIKDAWNFDQGAIAQQAKNYKVKA